MQYYRVKYTSKIVETTDDTAGTTKYTPQRYFWRVRKLLLDSATWTALLENENSYAVQLTVFCRKPLRHSVTPLNAQKN
jgi:hypothetical protein